MTLRHPSTALALTYTPEVQGCERVEPSGVVATGDGRYQDTVEVVEALYRELCEHPPATSRPASTYRLQFNPQFTLADATRLVPYLQQLGITHVYASPCYRATPGSPHGYDVHDLGELNPELGTLADFDLLADTLRHHGMGLVMDFVSNHLGVGGGNPYWMDLLEGGPTSPAAAYFDIDWSPSRSDLAGRILIPVLSDQYGAVLERGELQLEVGSEGLYLRYFDQRFPVCLNSWPQVLEPRSAVLQQALGVEHPQWKRFTALLADLSSLPATTDGDPAQVARRQATRPSILAQFAESLESAAIHEYIRECVGLLNGTPGRPASFDALDALIARQPYRLADWRVAGEEINYRRFFDINSLAAIRMEIPAVFDRMHRLVLQWLERGVIDGLRIDHPDGLYDPAAYFAQLQEEQVIIATRRLWQDQFGMQGEWSDVERAVRIRFRQEAALGQAGPLQRPLYVVIEKILAYGERMPSNWTIDGTTGYEFLNSLNGLFVDRTQTAPMEALYRRFTHQQIDFTDLVYRKKRMVMADAMASEINMLAQRLSRLADMNRTTRDFTLNSLKRLLVEYVACLGVYRTYLNAAGGTVAQRDRRYIEHALIRARRKAPGLDESIFLFLQDVLLLRLPHDDAARREAATTFVMKLQQLTGAIMAKGVEDTCFYIYNRLLSLNEVGGEPPRFGSTLDDFHRRNLERLEFWPGAMSSTSTHDTKRSEDVRARLNVLSEIPDEWKYHLGLWHRIHLRHKQEVHGRLAPSRNEAYFLYQTLIGTWPRALAVDDSYRQRIRDTMRKALREARLRSSWLKPDLEYEDAVLSFVDAVLHGNEAFMADLIPFLRRITMAGLHNSLSQVLLKIASPGVPDIYQGCELWDDSLVDPDNRRPVNFETRVQMLEEIDRHTGPSKARPPYARGLYAGLQDPLEDGRFKLYVTALLLRFRRQHAALFHHGRYLPLQANEERRNHVCAFARQADDQLVVVVAPLQVYSMLGREGLLTPDAWEDTWIPVPGGPAPQRFVNVLTGARLHSELHPAGAGLWLRKVLGNFPLALLQRL